MNSHDLLFGSNSEVSRSFSHEEMEMVFPPNLICWVSISASFSTSPVMHGICMATWFKWQGDWKDETKWKKHPDISKSDPSYPCRNMLCRDANAAWYRMCWAFPRSVVACWWRCSVFRNRFPLHQAKQGLWVKGLQLIHQRTRVVEYYNCT